MLMKFHTFVKHARLHVMRKDYKSGFFKLLPFDHFSVFSFQLYHLKTVKIFFPFKIHFLNKFQIFWYFSTYQTLRRLPLLKFANSQHFPLAPFARFIGSLMRLN